MLLSRLELERAARVDIIAHLAAWRTATVASVGGIHVRRARRAAWKGSLKDAESIRFHCSVIDFPLFTPIEMSLVMRGTSCMEGRRRRLRGFVSNFSTDQSIRNPRIIVSSCAAQFVVNRFKRESNKNSTRHPPRN